MNPKRVIRTPAKESLFLSSLLRATMRCLIDDLDYDDEVGGRPVEQLEHRVIRAFVEKRSQNPVGVEKVEPLVSNVEVYTLHAGRWRGATWHDEEERIVWLLAARLHRSGERGDAYPYFKALDAAERLLPTQEDYELAFTLREAELPAGLYGAAQKTLHEARRTPRQDVRYVIGDTFTVSVVGDK